MRDSFRTFDKIEIEDHTDYGVWEREIAAWQEYFDSFWHRRLWRWVTGLWRRGR